MDKEFGKARKKIKGNGVYEDDRAQEFCDRAHPCSNIQEEVRTHLRHAQKKEIDLCAIDRSLMAIDRT
jgi:hypothetical protein